MSIRALLKRSCLALAGLLLAEVAFRGALFLLGRPYDAGATRQSVIDLAPGPLPREPGDEEPRADEGSFLHPFHGYEIDNGHVRTRNLLQVQSMASAEELADTYEILIVGGSVSMFFGAAVNGGTESLAAVLQQDARFAGKKIVCFNQGRSAFKQPQQLFLTASLFHRGFVPDAVIVIDGFNEVALGMLNLDFDTDPLYPSFQYWGHLVAGGGSDAAGIDLASAALELEREHATLARWSERLGLYHSAITGLCVGARARELRSDWEVAMQSYLGHEAQRLDARILGGLSAAREPEEVLAAVVDHWVESSRSLHALCAERGVEYLHVLQPNLLDEGSKRLTDQERGYLDVAESVALGVRLGYPRLREAGERLRELGVPFVDASDVFRDEEGTIYIDACHFVRPGCGLLGERIGQAFLRGLEEVPGEAAR